MNKLTRDNLQEFCRTCLGSLQSPPLITLEANADNSDAIDVKQIYILNLLPQLREMLISLTSSDNARISSHDIDDNGQIYPQSLCRLCYDKLIDFQEFRNLVITSADILYKIVNNRIEDVPMGETPYENDDGDDNLILPEVAPLMGKTIKTEPAGDGFILPNYECAAIPSNVFIKDEIDLGYEKEGDVEEEGDVDTGLGENYSVNFHSAALSNAQEDVADATYKKRSLKCPRCEKIVYKQTYLHAHIRTEHEGHEKGFLCVECQKDFTRYDDLHKHIQLKHTKQERFICGINGCGAKFRLSRTLEKHWRVGHDTSSNNLQELQYLQQQKLICILCSKKYSSNRALFAHQKRDHSDDFPELQNVQQQKLICKICSKSYSSKRTLFEHQKRSHWDERKYVCKVCNVAKVTNRELQIHIQTHKPNREKFKCSICPQEFNHKNAISRHVRVVHEGQRRFPCSYCPRRFSTRNSQTNHERLHTGERPFACELCHRSFIQIEGLKAHMKSHDDTLRQHVCTICDKRFITKKNLLDHAQRHQSDKPHLCNVCSRGYSSIEDLNAHKQSHTKEELQARMVRKNEQYQDGDDAQHLGGSESVVEAFLGCSSSMSSFESNSTTTTTI